ncbi:MAG: DoxX family protein [Candidatus Omnitrophica bacterium]|nr:DoxX family protein [Candidatus Omnitrophota bacterium]
MMDLAILVIRLGLGIMFFAHGLQMAFGLFGGSGPEKFAEMLVGLEFRPALFWSYLAAYTVLIGGLFLILGISVRTTSIFLIIFMLVAAIKVHLSKGFFITNGGFEYNFVVIFVLIGLLICGAGKFSLFNKL